MQQFNGGEAALSQWRRNVTVHVLAHLTDRTVNDTAQKLYGKEGPEAVLKAAVSPASTTGWGSATVNQRLGAFLTSLRPRSAAAQLIERGLLVDFTGVSSVSLPRAQTAYPVPAWVAEGESIPTFRGDFGTVLIGPPKKMAALTAMTNEVKELSAEDAEAIIESLMVDAAARSLDATMFSTAAATAVAPAGLLNGVTPLTATAGGGAAALAGDIGKLVSAIHAAAGGSDIVLIMAPTQAATAPILSGSPLTLSIITAPNLAAGTVIAIEASAFASGFSDAPRVDIGREATIHMDDAVPTAISTAGTPNTVAAPVQSMFQVDAVALRLILRVAYGMRAPGLVQYIVSATW